MVKETPATYRKNPAVSTFLTNPAAIQAGSDSHGLVLAATEIAFHRCTVMAKKEAGTDDTVAGDNTGIVYIGAEDNARSAIPLAPGESMELPPNGDLSAYFLMVATADDGILIMYQT
jgi:hypothetical protein